MEGGISYDYCDHNYIFLLNYLYGWLSEELVRLWSTLLDEHPIDIDRAHRASLYTEYDRFVMTRSHDVIAGQALKDGRTVDIARGGDGSWHEAEASMQRPRANDNVKKWRIYLIIAFWLLGDRKKTMRSTAASCFALCVRCEIL